jgi:Lon protease-like protein
LMPKRPLQPADLPQSVPLFPLSGALLLPFAHRPLNIFEPRYIDMIDAALGEDRLIGLVQPEDSSEESPKGDVPLQKIGCLGRITHFEESGDGRYFIILEGVARFRLAAEHGFALWSGGEAGITGSADTGSAGGNANRHDRI